jgi:hypothetical protein
VATKNTRKDDRNDSIKNPAAAKYARLLDDAPTGAASWEEVDGRIIKAVIVAASEDGCAVIFGKTQDGGALSFTLLNPGPPVKKYPKNGQLAESALHEVLATIAS